MYFLFTEMKLSPKVGIGLKRLGNQNLIASDSFKKLVEISPDIILKNHGSHKTDLKELCTSKSDIVKECFAALLILLVEAASHDLDDKSFRSVVESYNFNPDRLKLLTDVYEKRKKDLRSVLFRLQHSIPQIIDVSWRLDFCIKSSTCSDNFPIFFIQLIGEAATDNTSGGIIIKKYNFLCSLEELEELVSGLKDATRHIESLAGIK
ncbi:COMM domain-containing protein 3-like isoform X1 [Nilaparvata lugens]|uniref:COMM domain-containing protein 3-like isoform X1 n=2 Tax=Nilaparvata lugens TaxID=108931 RepID=UPI000B99194C|nr:COMM domain-containing protein 3-like isoform X1 [Nilaparvata lugens]